MRFPPHPSVHGASVRWHNGRDQTRSDGRRRGLGQGPRMFLAGSVCGPHPPAVPRTPMNSAIAAPTPASPLPRFGSSTQTVASASSTRAAPGDLTRLSSVRRGTIRPARDPVPLRPVITWFLMGPWHRLGLTAILATDPAHRSRSDRIELAAFPVVRLFTARFTVRARAPAPLLNRGSSEMWSNRGTRKTVCEHVAGLPSLDAVVGWDPGGWVALRERQVGLPTPTTPRWTAGIVARRQAPRLVGRLASHSRDPRLRCTEGGCCSAGAASAVTNMGG